MDQQLATHNARLELQRDLEEALARAEQGAATHDDIALLAWASGIQRKEEKRHEME